MGKMREKLIEKKNSSFFILHSYFFLVPLHVVKSVEG